MFRAQRALPLAVIAVAVLATACGSSGSKSGSATNENSTSGAVRTTTTTGSEPMAHLSGSMQGDYIKAADQTSDGTKLVVEDVGLHGHPGFVVAVADNGGAMGDALGASALVHPGATMGVTVPLTKPLSTTAKVFVVLHIDNGDGAYTSADAPATVDGKVVELPIEVTVH